MMNRKGQAGMVLLLGVILIMVGSLFYCLLAFDTVDANHMGVKNRFGVLTGTQEPGLRHTGIFTSVYQYDLRTRKEIIHLKGEQSAVDKTGQAIFGTININYRIKPVNVKDVVTNLYKNIGKDSEIANKLNLQAIVREGFKQATVKYEALDILEKRQEVKELAKANIKQNFPNQYFEIENIVITNIDFSTEFKSAIEAKKVESQNKLKEQEKLQVVILQQQQEIERAKAVAESLRLQKSEINELLIKQQWIEAWKSGGAQVPEIITGDKAGMFLQFQRD